MDPLKKLVADRLKAQVAGPHPHAEALSAFAEAALPASERETVLQHLSTCSDCREVVFLAAPMAAESQQVLSKPKSRPVFALRWGTLAACLVIAAVFLVSRHQAPRYEQSAKSLPQAAPAAPAATASDAIVAAEKTPTELREMRDRMPAKVGIPSATNGHAEPKHITAKPEGNMAFADSGEVSVNAPTTLDAKVEPRAVQDLPTTGRNVAHFKQISPGAPQAASAPAVTAGTGSGVAGDTLRGLNVGGPIKANAYPYGVSAGLSAKELDAFHGSVTGTVVDSSGAVIPNAKVTALGPLGTKTVTSDQAGKYELHQLAAGNYRLKFDAPGFRETQLQQVAVLADKPANVDVKLNPGAMAETVEITAAAPSITQQAQQQVAVQTDQQQQSANQIQAQDLQVEAAVVRVPRAAKKNKDQPAVLGQALAKSWAVPVWHWSVSPQGAVQRSGDIGKTWQPVPVKADAIFRAISSIGPEVWAGGNGGALYHSTDSGLHWTQVVPIERGGEKLQSDIVQIQFVDSPHLTLTTSTSQVWMTADGGQNWTRK
jgi:hypothetical protein